MMSQGVSSQYGSSIDAFYSVINSRRISDVSTSSTELANGIQYSFVEITCSDGSQYGLQAYGKEAEELNRVALQNKPHLWLLSHSSYCYGTLTVVHCTGRRVFNMTALRQLHWNMQFPRSISIKDFSCTWPQCAKNNFDGNGAFYAHQKRLLITSDFDTLYPQDIVTIRIKPINYNKMTRKGRTNTIVRHSQVYWVWSSFYLNDPHDISKGGGTACNIFLFIGYRTTNWQWVRHNLDGRYLIDAKNLL
jgi:hypothetical protein